MLETQQLAEDAIPGRLGLAVLSAALSLPAAAQELIRHPIPNSDFPILQAVEVPAGMTTVYLSGTVPAVINQDAEPGSLEAYGDTEKQTISVMTRIQSQLEAMDMSVAATSSRCRRSWWLQRVRRLTSTASWPATVSSSARTNSRTCPSVPPW